MAGKWSQEELKNGDISRERETHEIWGARGMVQKHAVKTSQFKKE
jgi:hypothetical protein